MQHAQNFIEHIAENFRRNFPWYAFMGILLIVQSAKNSDLDPAIYFLATVLTMLYGKSLSLTCLSALGGVMRLFPDSAPQQVGFLLQAGTLIYAAINLFRN